MTRHKGPTPLRIALLALPLAIVTGPAVPASDVSRLESRVSHLEDRIAYFDDLLRDVRTRGPVERQFADTDRRLRAMQADIATLRSQINMLENRLAELGEKEAPAAAPPPESAKPNGQK